jgi:hypothetical protein
MISGISILIVMAIAVIMVFFVAITIISVTCGYEQDQSFEREKEAVSPREFWLLLSLLVGGILIILVLFITLIWSF